MFVCMLGSVCFLLLNQSTGQITHYAWMQDRNLHVAPPTPDLQPFLCFFGALEIMSNVVRGDFQAAERDIAPALLNGSVPSNLKDPAMTVFDFDLLLLPRSTGSHFYLFVVDMINHRITAVDSMQVCPHAFVGMAGACV